jgi:hypothetical protein
MNKKKFLVGLTFGALATIGFLSYPLILRWQIEKRVPGIQFQDASLSFSGVKLSNVQVHKNWIDGELDTVISDFKGEHVTISGGSLNVNLDKRPKEGEGHKKDIKFENLNIEIIYGKYNLALKDAKSNNSNICFTKGTLQNPPIIAKDGCIEKETKIASIQEIKLDQFDLMGLQVKDLIANNVKINIKEKSAEIDSLSAQLTFEKQTFEIAAEAIHASHNPDIINSKLIKIKHPWISIDWTTINNVVINHNDAWQLSIGSSNVELDSKTLGISGSESCSTWIDSLPINLKTSPLDKIKFTGNVNFAVTFRPKPNFNLKSDCRATCNTVPNLRQKFKYTAYTSKHQKFERESGRGSREWISIGLMGEMPLAATTMEDPGFQHHRGFITQAFANSFIDNLKLGRFFRGGSTITMQLAKNIWLTRDKTLGRKIQEFFLAQAIESCYTKDEILELYLNVVEFGPDQYGVAAGSQYWFNRGPGELLPPEAFWLASILPRPNRTEPPSELSLKRIEDLMKKLAADGRIPDFDLESQEQESVEEPK